jgi:flagellar biogenesis protein FliO
MATPLLVCTKAEQRSMVHFLWTEGTLSAAIQMFMFLVWGQHAFSEKSIRIEKNVQWLNKCD